MIRVTLFVMAMAFLLVTACGDGEDKLYTVDELTENTELRNEIIDNFKEMRRRPTELEMKNMDTAYKIDRELNRPKSSF